MMLHTLLAPGDWFAPKKYGIGAGRPIAWQGWLLMVTWLGMICGLTLLATKGERPLPALAIGLFATGLLLIIAARRTRGGWKWRWGTDA